MLLSKCQHTERHRSTALLGTAPLYPENETQASDSRSRYDLRIYQSNGESCLGQGDRKTHAMGCPMPIRTAQPHLETPRPTNRPCPGPEETKVGHWPTPRSIVELPDRSKSEADRQPMSSTAKAVKMPLQDHRATLHHISTAFCWTSNVLPEYLTPLLLLLSSRQLLFLQRTIYTSSSHTLNLTPAWTHPLHLAAIKRAP
ncbi:uncharacterized protein BDV17DRAFT_67785 [Aspergillus undulatus]|uniref:uncharacterized protein n=1 Tax=Aspergillus undulatus TaxID=1810928 RepID=UPI003CCE2F8B